MSFEIFTRERILFSASIPGDLSTRYWRRDDAVYYCHDRLAAADPNTFRFYLGGFAKDKRTCYRGSARLRDADPTAFRALNFCYATDGRFVWTLGGVVSGADPGSFRALDDGAHPLSSGWWPVGYASDQHRVYYQDHQGKPGWVRKATSATFQTGGDRTFGTDHRFVFCGRAVLAGASVTTWRPLGSDYSTDGAHVFYSNRRIVGADADTFRVESIPGSGTNLATDARSHYWNDRVVTEHTFGRLLREAVAQQRV